MKNIFLPAAMATAIISSAFGAASLRAPQIGANTKATTNSITPARAGTLRAQTMKTTSVIEPTNTQSIETPAASSGTTDARISFLKGIKNLNPGKVKDTAAAQQELNTIDARIDELQSKLDEAKADAENVITTATIDTKIEEKLASLEEKLTSISANAEAKDTYTKSEINKLLPYVEGGLMYLPVQPGLDPSQQLIVPEWRFRNMGYDQSSDGLVTYHKFVTLAPDADITQFITEFCQNIDNGNSYWCNKYGDTTLYNSNTGERMFKIIQRHHGYKYVTISYTYGGGTVYTTNEHDSNNNPTTYINTHVCGNANGTNNCHVTGYHANTGTDFAKYTVDVATGNSNVFQWLDFTDSSSTMTTSKKYGTNASTEAIENFAEGICGTRTERWCALVDVADNPDYNPTTSPYAKTFRIVERDKLNNLSDYATNNGDNSIEVINHNGVTYLRVNMIANTDKGVNKARELALDLLGCNRQYYEGGIHPCYLTSLTDNCASTSGEALPCNLNVQDHYNIVGIREIETEAQLPAPLAD